MTSGAQLIGFGTSKSGNDTFYGKIAATGDILPTSFHECTAEELAAAVQLAKDAFPAYRKKTDAERASFLRAIAQEIINLGDELIETAYAETALPTARIQGERGRTTGQIEAFAAFISDPAWTKTIVDPAQPNREPLPKPHLIQKQIPLGPVAVFGASNFPLAFSVAGGDCISALAAGCPVVFKAHPGHPNTCELVGKAIIKAAQSTGMPEGTFSMIHGRKHTVGSQLVQHPNIKAVGFTGSYQGGKALFNLAVRRPQPIPVYAEMGSINPVVLFSERIKAQGDSLVEGLSGSICLGVGQFCTNPGLVLLLKQDIDFLQKVADKLNQMPLGTFLNEGIASAFQIGVEQFAKHPKVKQWTKNELGPNLFSVDSAAVAQHPELLEEVFGPSTIAILCENKSDLIQVIENLPGQLTGTIQAEKVELEANMDIVEALEQRVGRILLNGFPTGVEVSPAMVHGGPFPATTDSRSTSVGTQAIYRFTRPICFQNFT
jgi:NADP-dependent aldehyde dehydrogenase